MTITNLPALASLLLLAAAAPLHAAEIQTHQFTPDGSLPFRYTNSEVSGPVIGAIAGVSGTFRVSLDLAGYRGTLLAIDDQLVNVHYIITSPTGMKYEPSKSGHNERILTNVSSCGQLPIDGELKLEGDELVMSFDGLKTLPNGGIVRIPAYSIRMKDGKATFTMDVFDLHMPQKVTQAHAVQLVPEPASLGMAAIGGMLVIARGAGGRREVVGRNADGGRNAN